MFSSYRPEDVMILLKDITGLVTPLGTTEREAFIQSGVHYSEMLPLEYEPSPKYLSIYEKALHLYAQITADAVRIVSERILQDKGQNTVLVSLARAGTSVGILMKHYIDKKYGTDIAHYTISIIRGKGIDKKAMSFILKRHQPQSIQFVDGWTGKGAIQRQLDAAVLEYPNLNSGLAVLSDPAYVAEKCGTHNDFLIASSCMNSTVSGLLSRTFFRGDIIGPDDFHGAAFYRSLLDKDLTYQFIDTVESHFNFNEAPELSTDGSGFVRHGVEEVEEICRHFQVSDINLVKPSIGEATRVLLRRIPWKVLVHSKNDEQHLGHLYQLAREKGVDVIEYPLQNYRACSLIQNFVDN